MLLGIFEENHTAIAVYEQKKIFLNKTRHFYFGTSKINTETVLYLSCMRSAISSTINFYVESTKKKRILLLNFFNCGLRPQGGVRGSKNKLIYSERSR